MATTLTPAEFIARKTPVPSEMLTRDWDRVRGDIKERAFFMAAVTRAEILDVFHQVSQDMAANKVGDARAQEIVREKLTQMGYAPAPGTEGSIKDLSSWRRLQTTLTTNRDLALGYARYQRQLQSMEFFPAKRMVRDVLKKEPRDWPARWRTSGAGGPAEGLNIADMSAHVTHPVWVRLSRFAVPYPPFDFGSGMGDRIIPLSQAEKLGVATRPPAEEPTATPATVPGVGLIKPSFNETLEAKPEIKSPAVREDLARTMKGTARWEGDRFVYLDPNGTRPATGADLAAVIGARAFPGQPTYQSDAAALYAVEGEAAFRAGSDALYDMARLVHRCLPSSIAAPLWAARNFPTQEALMAFLASLEGGFKPAPGWPFLACDLALEAVLGRLPDALTNALVLTIRAAVSARDLRAVMRTVTRGADVVPGIFLEAGTRLRVVREQTVAGVRQVICEEVTP